MKTAGTIQTGGVCERCDKQVGAGRTVLFLDRTPYPKFICCSAPVEAEEAAVELEQSGQFENAARTWRLASGRCLGQKRADRYAAAAERCERRAS